MTTSVQKCNKVCTKTTTHVSPVVTHVPKHYGKGRLLLGVGKGKGYAHAVPKVDCDVVCHEVPVTTFKKVCGIKTRITTSCHKEMDTVCNQVSHRLWVRQLGVVLRCKVGGAVRA